MEKEAILDQFDLFSLNGEGIGGWLTSATDERVFQRLATIDKEPLSRGQLNQLLVLGRQAPVSDGFFRYYWLNVPVDHPYPVDQLSEFEESWLDGGVSITSLSHLHWGLYRLFTDALLYFGNVRTAFRSLRILSYDRLISYFNERRLDTSDIKHRGPALPINRISADDRYLVSEHACKSFGDGRSEGEMRQALVEAYGHHTRKRSGNITFRQLLNRELPQQYSDQLKPFLLSLDDVLDESIASNDDFETKFGNEADRFFEIRSIALENTKIYLSMTGDLDVYVATSMGARHDFRDFAGFCDTIFSNKLLSDLHLRYFDPTSSAAQGHEDKGLIECLMVKCAKVLICVAGESDSYGKSAEVAMALSLGKPVIFYCPTEIRRRIFRDVHPLSRLIEFETGVAVGAIVTDKLSDVVTLLHRIFENTMLYELQKHPIRTNYLRLVDKLTESVIRVQTDDTMLTETFGTIITIH